MTETPSPHVIDADTLSGGLKPIRQVILSLGSNLGDREANLQGAVDALRDTPDVVVPTLYLWGDADQTVGRTAAELTAEHVSGPYRFVEIAGGGHFLTDDASNAVVERELLAHIRTGRPSD